MQPLGSYSNAYAPMYGRSAMAAGKSQAAHQTAAAYPGMTQSKPAQSFASQGPAAMPGLLELMMQMMQMMFTLFSQSFNASSGNTTPPGAASGSVGGVGSPDGAAGGYGTGSNTAQGTTGNPYGGTPATGGANAAASGIQPPPQGTPLSQDDLINYVLAGSKGGTAGTDEGIFDKYAKAGSRFGKAGANEFDAVIAKAYTAQFKAYAMGLPAAFIPGQTTVEQVAGNIDKAQQVQFTPEAEMLANVAAVYRGDFGGASIYNNAALKDLLISWGRSDIANQPSVGVTDVESIGGAVKALNEEKDPAIRQAWLQQIFDFQNNTPTSPSGAVPKAAEYQKAIELVKNGTINQLVNNYLNGIQTNNKI